MTLNEAIARAEPHARRAIELDNFDADAHRGLAWVLMLQKKHDLAEQHLDRAIECNPNDYHSFCMKGWFLVGSGRADDAASCISATMRLNPLAPDLCLEALMFAAYLDGRYQDALDIYPRIHQADSTCEALKAGCLAKLGRMREAREAASRALELGEELIRQPDWIDKWRLADDRDIEHFLSGMYAAGVLVDPAQKSRKPSIVVLRFANHSTQDGQEYFAAGMSTNIRACLSRVHALKVMSAFEYDSGGKSNLQIAQAFEADYLLSGSVQREEDRVRVFVELTDGHSGAIVWSERFDRRGEAAMDIQDDLAMSIVATLWGHRGRIREALRESLATKQTRDFNAFDCVLKGIYCKEQFTTNASIEAHKWFAKAIEIDPLCAEAHAWQALVTICDMYLTWPIEQDGLEKSFIAARRAIEIDRNCVDGHLALGWAFNWSGDPERGFAAFDRAMQINPNNSDLMVFKGVELAIYGRYEEGIELILQGINFNKQPPEWYFWHLGLAYFSGARPIEAIDAFEKMNRQNKETLVHLIACYASTNRQDRAAQYLAELMREDPQFGPEQIREIYRHYSDDMLESLLQGLEIAMQTGMTKEKLRIVRA
jgi:TolB-like protein/Tfp pilus assembly protein PilF